MNPEQQSVDDQEVQIDQSDMQAADESTQADEKNLPGGGSDSLQSEASELDQSNIIDDDSGAGGRSVRSTRGDPMAADKAIDEDIDNSEKALS
ncbi:hypothetical protein CBS101457_004886 [Exobasidium rhododendri]|nr:hypothetical protein CBS101457_004886 [Exobasidium rhododendri]